MSVEGEEIQNRNEYDRSPEKLELVVLDQLPNGPGAVDFVAVQRGRDEHDGAVHCGPANVNGNPYRHAAVALAHSQLHVDGFACRDFLPEPFIDGLSLGPPPRPLPLPSS